MSSERARGVAGLVYVPGHSVLHRLHPLTKVAWLTLGTVGVFAVPSPWFAAASLVLLLIAFAATGLDLRRVRGWRLLTVTALLLGLLQLLVVRSGAVLWHVGPVRMTVGGARAGAYVAGRFLAVVLLSSLFVLTTEPGDLAYALMRAGLPYRYGFALITALRLVPTFEQEAQVVYSAQLARGVRYDVRSPRRVLLLARQFVVPLLISALGKIDALAVSMEGRAFGKYPTRTFLREVSATWRDGVALGVLLALVGIVVWLRICGGI
jgi:energy-coupling factor transport system permease protein